MLYITARRRCDQRRGGHSGVSDGLKNEEQLSSPPPPSPPPRIVWLPTPPPSPPRADSLPIRDGGGPRGRTVCFSRTGPCQPGAVTSGVGDWSVRAIQVTHRPGGPAGAVPVGRRLQVPNQTRRTYVGHALRNLGQEPQGSGSVAKLALGRTSNPRMLPRQEDHAGSQTTRGGGDGGGGEDSCSSFFKPSETPGCPPRH